MTTNRISPEVAEYRAASAKRTADAEAKLLAENVNLWVLATSALEMEKTDDGWLVVEHEKRSVERGNLSR